MINLVPFNHENKSNLDRMNPKFTNTSKLVDCDKCKKPVNFYCLLAFCMLIGLGLSLINSSFVICTILHGSISCSL